MLRVCKYKEPAARLMEVMAEGLQRAVIRDACVCEHRMMRRRIEVVFLHVRFEQLPDINSSASSTMRESQPRYVVLVLSLTLPCIQTNGTR